MKSVRITKNEWNYLKEDRSYLFDNHVKFCFNFKEGLGIVQYNDNIYNFVNSEGKRLLKTNVHNCCDFNNGFTYVKINNVWYYIDKECNFYNYKNKVSFKKLYCLYPNKRSELIEIISKYTYYDVEEYFI